MVSLLINKNTLSKEYFTDVYATIAANLWPPFPLEHFTTLRWNGRGLYCTLEYIIYDGLHLSRVDDLGGVQPNCCTRTTVENCTGEVAKSPLLH